MKNMFKGFVYLSSFCCLGLMLSIIGYIIIKGLPYLNSSLFSWNYTSTNVSMLPSIINTIVIIGLSLLIAIPIGIGAAIYLTQYATYSNVWVRIIRLMSETLAGIPSIIYGLFGAIFFVQYLHIGLSLLSGSLTLSIMILPLIIKTAEEALWNVPNSYIQGSYALGASKLYTIFKVLLPSALGGIFSGIVLAIGRIIGESAALLFTAGTSVKIVHSIFDSARTLAVHMYVISGEGLFVQQAYATATILLLVVIVVNMVAEYIVNKLGEQYG